MIKEQIDADLFLFLINTSQISSEKCSLDCGIQKYEKYLCKIEKLENLEFMNYGLSQNCFQRCMKKNFESSILALNKLFEVSKFKVKN